MLKIKPRSGQKETSQEAEGMAMQDISATHSYPRHRWYIEYLENEGLMFFLARGPLLTDNERLFKLCGPLRSLSYNDEDTNETITFFIQKNGEQALKEIAISEINCEFDMIQPVALRKAMKDKIRTNSNLIPTLLPYIRQQHPAQGSESKKEKVMVSKKRTTDSSPGSRSAEKKQRPMASIKEVNSESEEMDTGAPGMTKALGIVASNQNILRENIKANKIIDVRTFLIQMKQLHRPPVDPETGRRTLEVRPPHELFVYFVY